MWRLPKMETALRVQVARRAVADPELLALTYKVKLKTMGHDVRFRL